MLHKLKEISVRTWIWFVRFQYRRGWGVHSPFAYGFIRDVLFETNAYYAYPSLAKMRKAARVSGSGRYDRLFFRLANFAMPENVVIFGKNAKVVQHYIASVRSAKNISVSENNLTEIKREISREKFIDLLYVNDKNHAQELYEASIEKTRPQSVFIIRGIYRDKKTKALWSAIETDKRTVLTFDLYYLGIVLFREGLNKQSYKVCY